MAQSILEVLEAFAKIWVCFSAPTWQLIVCSSSSKELSTLFWPIRLLHACRTHPTKKSWVAAAAAQAFDPSLICRVSYRTAREKKTNKKVGAIWRSVIPRASSPNIAITTLREVAASKCQFRPGAFNLMFHYKLAQSDGVFITQNASGNREMV